jgi:hypothetical protein
MCAYIELAQLISELRPPKVQCFAPTALAMNICGRTEGAVLWDG